MSYLNLGREWTPGRETDVDVSDGGDILLPKPATPQPGCNKMDRRKEGKSKREQEEEERERMQLVSCYCYFENLLLMLSHRVLAHRIMLYEEFVPPF